MRRTKDPIAAAEAVFKKAASPPPVDIGLKKASLPVVKQLVSIRLDEDVIEHFQAAGPRWQERINDVLKRSIQG